MGTFRGLPTSAQQRVIHTIHPLFTAQAARLEFGHFPSAADRFGMPVIPSESVLCPSGTKNGPLATLDFEPKSLWEFSAAMSKFPVGSSSRFRHQFGAVHRFTD